MDGEDKASPKARYKDSNTNPDGSYKVGKNKPPEDSRFRKGDGRPRGRRKKDTKNLATDFLEEMESKIIVKVNGKEKRVTRQRSIVMRLADSASRGQNAAIQTVLKHAEKYGRAESLEAGMGVQDFFPHINDLTWEEHKEFDRIFAKMRGEEYVDPDTKSPLYRDPDDPLNWYSELTVEGVHLRGFMGRGGQQELVRIESRAYFSAALPRRQACFRRRV